MNRGSESTEFHLVQLAAAKDKSELALALQTRPGRDVSFRYPQVGTMYANRFGPLAWAISRLAPEWTSSPNPVNLLVGDERGYFTVDHGAWLTVLARALRGSGALILSVATPRPSHDQLKNYKPILAVQRPKIFPRSPAALMADDDMARQFNGLILSIEGYLPHAFDLIARTGFSAHAPTTMLVSAPCMLMMALLWEAARRMGYAVTPPLSSPVADLPEDDPECPGIRIHSWWMRLDGGPSELTEPVVVDDRVVATFTLIANRINAVGRHAEVVRYFAMERTVGEQTIAHVDKWLGVDVKTGRWVDAQTGAPDADPAFPIVSSEALAGYPDPDLTDPVAARARRALWMERVLGSVLRADVAGEAAAVPAHEPANTDGEVAEATEPLVTPNVKVAPVEPSIYRRRSRTVTGKGLYPILAFTANAGLPEEDAESVRDWFRSKVRNWLGSKGFRLGEGVSIVDEHESGEVRIESNPEWWAMRLDDRAAAAKGAWWRVEVTMHTDGGTTVAVRVAQMRSDAKAPAPDPAVPRFVRDLVQSARLHEEGMLLRDGPWRPSGSAELAQLVRQLKNPARRRPVVVFATDSSASLSDVASRLAAVVHVVAADADARAAITDAFGQALGVHADSARIYFGHFDAYADPFDHPRWPLNGAGDLSERDLADLVAEACAAVVHSDDLDLRVPTFRQVADVVRADRVRVAVSRAHEVTASVQEERDRFLAAMKELESRAEALHRSNSELDERRRQALEDLSRLAAERDQALEENRELRYRVRALTSARKSIAAAEGATDAVPYPDAWDELDEWVEKYGMGRLVLLPQAAKAARASAFADVPFAFKVLHFLAKEYVELRLRDPNDNAPIEACDRRKVELGIEVSPVGDAAEDRRYKKEYQRIYNGKKRTLDMHVKRGAGFDPTQLFRCYYFYDDDARTVVVGHLPTHLTNRMSN